MPTPMEIHLAEMARDEKAREDARLARDRRQKRLVPLIAVGVVATLAAVFGIAALANSATKADGGEVIVVRNGGLFDANDFRQIVTTADGLTLTGLWSTNHSYPTSQRNFVVSAADGADSNEVINVPTSDGVNVGIEGVFYFTLNQDPAVLRDFDDRFGLRTYGSDGDKRTAWGSDEGWQSFLDFTMGNLVQNVLRQEIGGVRCAELVASCELIQNPNATIAEGDGNGTIASIQTAVNDAFNRDVNATLGGPIFSDITFTLSKVALPQNVQDAINGAQAANALTAQANAEAAANNVRQQGYNACPVCGEIDLRKAIPQSITVWAPGADTTVAVR